MFEKGGVCHHEKGSMFFVMTMARDNCKRIQIIDVSLRRHDSTFVFYFKNDNLQNRGAVKTVL